MRIVAGALLGFFIFLGIGGNAFAQTSLNADQTRVLQGIPNIARAFALVGGVKWETFAQVLAGICAVESQCNPRYPHYVNKGGSNVYSQYQGLFQMNMAEVAKAEANLQQMLPRMEQLAQTPEDKKAVQFVRDAITASKDQKDRRFHPEYGIVLGAAKHIQINPQLAKQYPNDPLRQASGHMTAQFSGITEGKIRNGQFNAPITGNPYGNPATEEAAALLVNKVSGGSTVGGAIEAAGRAWGSRMKAMMDAMSSATNGLTKPADVVRPFAGPDYNPGTGALIDQPYNAVSTLMESGFIPRTVAPVQTISPTTPTSLLQQAQSGAPAQSGGTQNQTLPGENVRSSFRIIAQPSRVSPGSTILVSWTSVNMQPGSCSINVKGLTTLEKSAEGTQRYQAPGGTKGVITFEMTCIGPDGGAVATETSVEVQ